MKKITAFLSGIICLLALSLQAQNPSNFAAFTGLSADTNNKVANPHPGKPINWNGAIFTNINQLSTSTGDPFMTLSQVQQVLVTNAGGTNIIVTAGTNTVITASTGPGTVTYVFNSAVSHAEVTSAQAAAQRFAATNPAAMSSNLLNGASITNVNLVGSGTVVPTAALAGSVTPGSGAVVHVTADKFAPLGGTGSFIPTVDSSTDFIGSLPLATLQAQYATNAGSVAVANVGGAGNAIYADTNTMSIGGNAATATTAKITTDSEVWVNKAGNDGTGTRGRMDKPFLTITAGANAALPGDWLHVSAGFYPEHNLLRQNVNYQFDPGVYVQWKQLGTNEDMLGIFDDTTCGPTTNYLSCPGTFELQGLTNVTVLSNYWVAFPDLAGTAFPNSSTHNYGVVTLTNAGSRLIGNIGLIKVGNMMSGGQPFGVSVINNNASRLSVDILTNSFDSSLNYILLNFDGQDDDLTLTPFTIIGVYWTYGDFSINVAYNYANQNGLWCDEPLPLIGTTANMYYSGEVITTKVYTTMQDRNSVLWFTCKYVDDETTSGVIGNAFDIYGSGKIYINGVDKIISRAPQYFCINLQPSVSAQNIWHSNSLVWVNCQKLEATNNAAWIKQLDGVIYGHIDTLSDGGNAGNIGGGLIFGGNAEAHLSGEFGAQNSSPMIANSSSALVEFKGYTLVDTNGPIISVSSNTLALQSVNLITYSNTATIAAPGPVSIAANGLYANTAPTNLVTLVSTNYGGLFIGQFAGDGSRLSNLNIPITTTNKVAFTNDTRAITMTSPSNQFGGTFNGVHIGDGSQVTNMNASFLTAGTVPAAQMPALTGAISTSAGSTVTTVAVTVTNQFTVTNDVHPLTFLNPSNTFVGNFTLNTNSLPTVTSGHALVAGLGASILTNFGHYSDDFIPLQIITGAGPLTATDICAVTFGTPCASGYGIFWSDINNTNVSPPAQIGELRIPWSLMTPNGFVLWNGTATVFSASTTNWILLQRIKVQ